MVQIEKTRLYRIALILSLLGYGMNAVLSSSLLELRELQNDPCEFCRGGDNYTEPSDKVVFPDTMTTCQDLKDEADATRNDTACAMLQFRGFYDCGCKNLPGNFDFGGAPCDLCAVGYQILDPSAKFDPNSGISCGTAKFLTMLQFTSENPLCTLLQNFSIGICCALIPVPTTSPIPATSSMEPSVVTSLDPSSQIETDYPSLAPSSSPSTFVPSLSATSRFPITSLVPTASTAPTPPLPGTNQLEQSSAAYLPFSVYATLAFTAACSYFVL